MQKQSCRSFLARCLAFAPIMFAMVFAPASAQAPAVGATPAGQYSRNVYLAGATVRLAEPVEGDLIAVGGRVIADKPVKGDAGLAGGSVDVRAPIGDDLRAAGGDVTIESHIGGEVYAGAGNVTVTRAARIDHGASLAGGLATVDGTVSGRLRVSAQRVVVNGEISGDVRLFADTVELGPQARIGGALRHASRTFERAESAVVVGPVTQEDLGPSRRDRDGPYGPQRHGVPWIGLLLGFLGLLLAGITLLMLFPRFSADAPERLGGAPWASLAIGFGALVGVPALALLLFVTVLGVALGVVTLALYPLLLLVGYLAGALFLAQRIRLALGKAGEAGDAALRARVGHLALALVVLSLSSLLPFAGPLVVFITTIAGMGACILELHRRRQAAQPAG